MQRTMWEIMEQAIGEMREVLAQEVDQGEAGYWDPDAWEKEVIQFTRQLGRRMVQTWAEVKAEQAKAQIPFCPCCGGRSHLHRWQPLWWLSVFGRIEVQAPLSVAPPRGFAHSRPPAFSGVDRVEVPGQVLGLATGIDRFWRGNVFRAGQPATEGTLRSRVAPQQHQGSGAETRPKSLWICGPGGPRGHRRL